METRLTKYGSPAGHELQGFRCFHHWRTTNKICFSTCPFYIFIAKNTFRGHEVRPNHGSRILSPITSTEGYKAGVDSQLFSPHITAEINIPGQFQVIKNDFSDLHLNQVLNYGRDGRKTSLVVSLV